MDITELINYLKEVREIHGEVEIRAVSPQYRTTPSQELRGAFVDSEGLVLVVREDGGYFSTDNDENFYDAQVGDFMY